MARLNHSSLLIASVGPNRQRGYLMIVSLMIILLITVMSISMAKTFFLEEGMAGNLREKGRSFQAAQAGLRYGEWAALQNGQAGGADCTVLTNPLNVGQICKAAVTLASANVATPVTTYFNAPTPAAVATYSSPVGGTATSPTTDTYYTNPGVYIQYMGPLIGGAVYQITAYGYGGTSNSISVVQSTLQVSCSNRSLMASANPC